VTAVVYFLEAPTTDDHGDRTDIEIIGTEIPLVPPGRYDAIGGRAKQFVAHGALKLCVEWRVELRPGAYVTLPRFYNVKSAPGGRFRAGPHTDYSREWTLVARRRVSRRERLSARVFKGALCAIEVATVTRDHRQRPLSQHAQYSRVAKIVEHKAGGGPC